MPLGEYKDAIVDLFPSPSARVKVPDPATREILFVVTFHFLIRFEVVM
jgi:hypothetical protein